MPKVKKESFKLEIIKGIGSDFLDLIDEEKEDPMENLVTIGVNKSFKVQNYNSNVSNSIIANMEIEFVGELTNDDKDFGKNLNHYILNKARKK